MVDSKCRVPGATLERGSIGTKNIIVRPACPRFSGLLLRKNIRGTNLAGLIRPELDDHSLAVSCTALHVLRHVKPAISTMPSRLWMFHAGRASGLGGLEPPTSPLSGARSSHLSYRPKSKNNFKILTGGPGPAQHQHPRWIAEAMNSGSTAQNRRSARACFLPATL